MKQPQTIALTAVLAVAVGMIGINGASGDIFGLDNNPEVATDGQAYLGHMTIKHYDSENNLLSYQQTDNVVTFTGKNCAANLLFDNALGNCTTPAVFDDIAISEDDLLGVGENADEAIILAGECNGAGFVCGAGLDARLAGTVTFQTVGADNIDAIVDIDATFTKTAGGAVTINSAGLFDIVTSDSGNVFAVRPFSTGVSMISGDSLAVTWSITLS